MTREEIQRITDRLWPDYTPDARRRFRQNVRRCHELGLTGRARGRQYLSVPLAGNFLAPVWCEIFDIPEQDQLQVAGEARMPLGRVRISDNFTLGEFRCRSFKCAEYPGEAKEIRLNLKLFESLELFRGQCDDQAITINSGFRSHGWNKYVGGAQASYHLDGWAADIQVKGMEPLEVFRRSRDATDPMDASRFLFGGVILYNSFVHVDVRDGRRFVKS